MPPSTAGTTVLPPINPDSPIPLYYQIRENLRDMINNGDFATEGMVPSERDLSEAYNVNRLTVRQAITELVNEGLLRRQRGVGTFVVYRDAGRIMPDISKLPTLTGFTERMLRIGRRPSSKLVSFGVQAPTATIARALSTTVEAEVIKIVRVRLADGQPIMLETSYLSTSIAPGLEAQQLVDDPSLYHVLSTCFHVLPYEAEEFIEPVILTSYEALLLDTEPGRSALLQEGIVYTADHKPIDFTKSVVRGDKARFYFQLHRTGENDPHA